jgi:protein phosphatase
MLTVATQTTPGAVRANNEDSLLWDPGLGLMAVADGMGGHNAGEVASRMALDIVQRFLKESSGEETMRWPFGYDGTLSLPVNRLRTAVKLANRDVLRTSEERPECAGMGTTLTAALASGPRLLVANVGDSRLYSYIRATGEFRQRTRDDSLVGMLSDAPGVDLTALEGHPMKHLLTNVLGRRAELDVHIDEIALADGEVLLLCSDGMHGSVADDSMRAVLETEDDLKRAADILVNAALDGGSRDNISIVLARYVV